MVRVQSNMRPAQPSENDSFSLAPDTGGTPQPAPEKAPESAARSFAPVADLPDIKPEPRFVIVTRGDTLGNIALALYGSARVDRLLRLNQQHRRRQYLVSRRKDLPSARTTHHHANETDVE